jgi:hypothetical protein
VQYKTDLDFEVENNSLVVIDEADYVIFSNPSKFLNKIKDMTLICFSATITDNKTSGLEQRVVEMMGISSIAYQPIGVPM